MYNITLIFPDGKSLSFQSPTLVIDGKPSTIDNHTVILSEKEAKEFIERAKNTKDINGYIPCSLSLVEEASMGSR